MLLEMYSLGHHQKIIICDQKTNTRHLARRLLKYNTTWIWYFFILSRCVQNNNFQGQIASSIITYIHKYLHINWPLIIALLLMHFENILESPLLQKTTNPKAEPNSFSWLCIDQHEQLIMHQIYFMFAKWEHTESDALDAIPKSSHSLQFEFT